MSNHAMLMGLLLTPLGCLAGLACAPQEAGNGAGGAMELRVEPGEVRAGEEVMITLVNGSAGDLGYNLCVATLDRREGGEWVERPEPPAEVCTMELRVLAPDDSASFRHTIPSGLPPGEYRFRTGVEAPLGGPRVDAESHAFRIIE